MNNARTEFSQAYRIALRRELGGGAKAGAAKKIGRSAVGLGLEASDIARAHGVAMVAMAARKSRPASGPKSSARGFRFLVAALAPLEHSHAAARNAALRVIMAQEDERRAISHELHDEVAQVLAGITLRLAGLTETSAISARSLRQGIAKTQRIVERSVRRVHRFARELRPALLDDLGLIPSLRAYIRDLPGRGKLRIRFKAVSDVERLDNLRRTVIYRVAQQALSNVVRHAAAKEATVTIGRNDGAIRLEVKDDGKSFAADAMQNGGKSQRLGLLGMRERVELIGGTFAVDSARGVGTTVRAQIPFQGRPTRGGK